MSDVSHVFQYGASESNGRSMGYEEKLQQSPGTGPHETAVVPPQRSESRFDSPPDEERRLADDAPGNTDLDDHSAGHCCRAGRRAGVAQNLRCPRGDPVLQRTGPAGWRRPSEAGSAVVHPAGVSTEPGRARADRAEAGPGLQGSHQRCQRGGPGQQRRHPGRGARCHQAGRDADAAGHHGRVHDAHRSAHRGVPQSQHPAGGRPHEHHRSSRRRCSNSPPR